MDFLSSELPSSSSSSSLAHCPSSDLHFDPRHDSLPLNSSLKIPRTDSFSLYPDLKMHHNGTLGSLVRSNSMLSDSRLGCSSTNSSSSDGVLLGGDSSTLMSEARWMRDDSMMGYSGTASRPLSFHQQAFAPRSSGLPLPLSREMANYFGMHDNERAGEPVFTANQLHELQHHALIFKYLMSGVNVPAELVHPIRTSVAALPGSHHHLTSIGWGNYHLGFAHNTDPEPGRCRRTDGKKWRCARDVVLDQKYCERHMHRGKHRSRKPPDHQNQNTSSSQTSSVVTSTSAVAAPGRASPSPINSSITLNLPQHRSSLSPGIKTFSATSSPNSYGGLSIGTSNHASNNQFQLPFQSTGLSAKDFRYLNGDLGQEQTFFSESSGNIRGLGQGSPPTCGLSGLCSVDNPLRSMQPKQHHQHSFLGGGFGSVETANVGRESEGQPLRHFFDDWPRTRDPSSLSWSDVEEDRSNRSSSTTLSISIPMTSSDFSSANASSPRGKLPLSPLKLSMSKPGDGDPLDVGATQMGLGVGIGLGTDDYQHRQNNWIPMTGELSVGGPLAEVLQSSNPRECKSSGLNLMTTGWENSPLNSPPMASPTGVLQNALSETSSGSSQGAIKVEPPKL